MNARVVTSRRLHLGLTPPGQDRQTVAVAGLCDSFIDIFTQNESFPEVQFSQGSSSARRFFCYSMYFVSTYSTLLCINLHSSHVKTTLDKQQDWYH